MTGRVFHPERCRLWVHRDAIKPLALSGASARVVADMFGSNKTTAQRFIKAMGWKVHKSPAEHAMEHDHIVYKGNKYTFNRCYWRRSSGNHESLARVLWLERFPDQPIARNEVIRTYGDIRDIEHVVLKKMTVSELLRENIYPEDDEYKRNYHKAITLANITIANIRGMDPEARRRKSERMKRLWAENHDELVKKMREAIERRLMEDPGWLERRNEKLREAYRNMRENEPERYQEIMRKQKETRRLNARVKNGEDRPQS